MRFTFWKKYTKYIIIAFLLFTFIQCSDNSVEPVISGINDNVVQQLINNFSDSTGCIGLSVGIIKDGKRAYYSHGVIDLQTKKATDENTIYEIASNTKSFTGFLIADLTEKHIISLDSSIDTLKDLKLPEYNGTKITIEDLVTHTSMLPRGPDNLSEVDGYDPLNPYKYYNLTYLKEFLNKYKLTEEPGSTFLYSNLGYAILGYTVEKLNKKDYEDLIKEKVCDPLGMNDTEINLNNEQKNRFATAYYYDKRVVPHWEYDVFKGAAAIRSTVKDLLSYIEGNLGTKAPQLYTRFSLTHQLLRNNYGMGWFVLPGIIFHDGLTYGNESYIKFDINKKIGLVILSNQALYFDKNSLNIYYLENEIWNYIDK